MFDPSTDLWWLVGAERRSGNLAVVHMREWRVKYWLLIATSRV